MSHLTKKKNIFQFVSFTGCNTCQIWLRVYKLLKKSSQLLLASTSLTQFVETKTTKCSVNSVEFEGWIHSSTQVFEQHSCYLPSLPEPSAIMIIPPFAQQFSMGYLHKTLLKAKALIMWLMWQWPNISKEKKNIIFFLFVLFAWCLM